MDKYRITKIEHNSIVYDVIPFWGKDVSLSGSRENTYRLKGEKIDGSIIFYKPDFELINSFPIGDKIEIIVEMFDGSAWSERYRTFFYKKDLKIDEDRKTAKVELNSNHRYSQLFSGRAKKFNLLEIPPAKTPVSYFKYPIFQIYVLGDFFVTNITNSNSFEQQISVPSNPVELTTNYFFNESESVHFIPGSNILDPDVSGRYFYNSNLNAYESGDYRIKLTGGTWEIFDILNGNILVYSGTNGQTEITLTVFNPIGGSGTIAKFYTRRIFSRIICNVNTVNGQNTIDIPDNDIVEYNPNYSKVLPINVSVFGSDQNSSDPTEYKLFSNNSTYFQNRYFDDPVDTQVAENFLPVSPTSWEYFSLWIFYNSTMIEINDYGKELITIQDAYKFGDVLRAILKKLDPTIIFIDSPGYSDFLYNPNNPVRGTGQIITPFFLPKTNIINGEYQKPATRADFSFTDIEEILKGWNCDYWIEDNRFRIESVLYFKNGGTYNGIQVVKNLNNLFEYHTKQRLTYFTNQIEYDKLKIPERIEIEWQEKGSKPFNGYPIEMLSEFAEIGNVENIKISNFFSDINFAIANPGEISLYGFMYLECIVQNGIYSPAVVNLDLGGLRKYTLQNGYASMIYMQHQYHRYNLPTPSVRLNQETTVALSTINSKIQNISFAGTNEFPFEMLVQTEIGNGEIDDYKITLYSGAISLILYHKTV